MSFIINRGYAEVQILKTSETDALSWTFWNIFIRSCPNSEKSKIKMDITKKVQLQDIIFLCVI